MIVCQDTDEPGSLRMLSITQEQRCGNLCALDQQLPLGAT